MVSYAQGEVLLAGLVFSDGLGGKRRPVLAVQDFGDDDLLVLPITSHPARRKADAALSELKKAGLKLPSTARCEKLATIEKSCVARKLGTLLPHDLARVKATLAEVFDQVLA